MQTANIQPTYITLRDDAQVQLSGQPLTIIEALQQFQGKATYQQLRKATKISLSSLYALVSQLKAAQIVEVVSLTP